MVKDDDGCTAGVVHETITGVDVLSFGESHLSMLLLKTWNAARPDAQFLGSRSARGVQRGTGITRTICQRRRDGQNAKNNAVWFLEIRCTWQIQHFGLSLENLVAHQVEIAPTTRKDGVPAVNPTKDDRKSRSPDLTRLSVNAKRQER
jgi:hypothetical protein